MSLKKRRLKFCDERKSCSDEEFLTDVHAETMNGEVFLAVRNTVAELCSVPRNKIHASEEPKRLFSLMNGWDMLGFGFRLEDHLGRSLSDEQMQSLPQPLPKRFFIWESTGFRTFGEWVIEVVRVLCDKPDPQVAAHG